MKFSNSKGNKVCHLACTLGNVLIFLEIKSVSSGKKKKIDESVDSQHIRNNHFAPALTGFSIPPRIWFIKNTTIMSQIRAIL